MTDVQVAGIETAWPPRTIWNELGMGLLKEELL